LFAAGECEQLGASAMPVNAMTVPLES
jgi:hypothetical protein